MHLLISSSLASIVPILPNSPALAAENAVGIRFLHPFLAVTIKQ